MTDERNGFAMFFRAHYAAVTRLAYLMTGDRASAEDVAQEAFVRLYARWGRVSRYERPDAWVRTVAVRLARRAAKRRRSESTAIIDEPSRPPERRDPELWGAVLSLSPAQRTAVVLHYYEDLPIEEVAVIMGCAGSTARVHLHRARRRLGELLGEETAGV